MSVMNASITIKANKTRSHYGPKGHALASPGRLPRSAALLTRLCNTKGGEPSASKLKRGSTDECLPDDETCNEEFVSSLKHDEFLTSQGELPKGFKVDIFFFTHASSFRRMRRLCDRLCIEPAPHLSEATFACAGRWGRRA